MGFSLAADDDLDVSGGTIHLVSTRAELVRQRWQARLRIARGEWVFDQRVGIPYFQSVLGKIRSLSAARSVLRRASVTCPGIASLSRFDVQFNAEERRLEVDAEAQLDTGETIDLTAVFTL